MFDELTTTITVEVPTLFYLDHRERDCGLGDTVEREGRYMTRVTLDQEGLVDLWTDADYYDGFSGEDRAWNRPVCESAGRTLNHLRKALAQAGIDAPGSVWAGL